MAQKIQKEILKFIIKDPTFSKKKNLNDISNEFKKRGYNQETIDRNLYLLAKSGKIGAATIDDEVHRVYAPLIVLDKGKREIAPWYKKHLLTVVTLFVIILGTIFSILSYFK